MPKKKRQESQKEQSARFQRDASALVEAGELNPIEADEAMNRMVRAGVRKRPESSDSG